MSGRKPTDDELRQWHAAMRNVRPLAGAQAKLPAAQRARKGAAKSTPLPAQTTITTGQRRLAPSMPRPIDRSNERQIRRGQQSFGASLDLHGHTQDSAWTLLPVFLQTARARGQRCVMVITGKGRGGDGVLRKNFLRWLEQAEAGRLVSGYAQAHPRHGGRGAWYVFLRRDGA